MNLVKTVIFLLSGGYLSRNARGRFYLNTPPLEDFFGTYQGGYLAQFQFKKNDFNSMFSGMNFIRKVKSWACFYNLVF